jgi:short subunit dehydrogenase-like uncharacterized protein
MKIAVYGAGGYTGRLVVAELSRRGIEPILVGRRVETLRRTAGGIRDAQVRTAGVDDSAALTASFDGCSAVVNCAGPFTSLGEPVVRAAIAAGCHYVDTTAEQLYIKRILEDCDADARRAGVSVVPAAGYDIVPGDMLCHLTGELVAPVRTLTLAYDIRHFGMTRGSAKSVLVMYTGGEVAYKGGDWRPGGGSARRAPVSFPGDAASAPTVRWPAGEIVTVPRHLEVADIEVVMRSDALVPGPIAAVAPSLMPTMTAVMRTPLRGVLERLVGLLPEGPSESKRRRARFAFVCEAKGSDGRGARGVLEGSDVYGTTATIAVEAASRLAGGGSPTGALAPAQAFDPAGFLDALRDRDLRWSVQTV